MTKEDLFIIVKVILLCNASIVQMPSDEEIKKFIEAHKEKEND